MDDMGSITVLIDAVRQGNERGAQQLFDRYFSQLLAVARRKLRDSPQAVEDEEDVVISALDSFIQRTRNQQFPQLKDRNNLWHLLLAITERKAINQRKRQTAQKRGGGRVVHDGALRGREGSDGKPGLDGLPSPEPTPEILAQLAEQCRRLLSLLDDVVLQEIASMKLEGYTSADIAAKLNVVERTIERKLHRIRSLWSDELA